MICEFWPSVDSCWFVQHSVCHNQTTINVLALRKRGWGFKNILQEGPSDSWYLASHNCGHWMCDVEIKNYIDVHQACLDSLSNKNIGPNSSKSCVWCRPKDQIKNQQLIWFSSKYWGQPIWSCCWSFFPELPFFSLEI